MDSVLMTSPSNSSKIKTRLRSVPSALLARHSKSKVCSKSGAHRNSKGTSIKIGGGSKQLSSNNRNESKIGKYANKKGEECFWGKFTR